MTESDAWKVLADGRNTDSTVLTVDFDSTGRPEARFSDLVANLRTDFAVWETIPPAGGTESAASGAGYIDHWARKIESERPKVRALLGFCAGSVYAAALAERIGTWQDDKPLLLLFDPELSTTQTLMWQFHKVTGFMSSVLSAEAVAEAREIGRRAYDETSELDKLKDALIELMWAFGEPALASAGLDEARRAELFGVFSTFMNYLAAAGDIDPLDQWRSAVACSSNTPLSGLNAMRAAGAEISVAREIHFDVDHGSMLAQKELAATVTDLLNSY
ncbi:hypothetical protein [Streptomyces sp. NPDC048516]|uniref:hypothetical protein n=1 Tax=Streptomyces sp. NPDC048516 TaxID=3365565 RepID=UPI00371D5F8B